MADYDATMAKVAEHYEAAKVQLLAAKELGAELEDETTDEAELADAKAIQEIVDEVVTEIDEIIANLRGEDEDEDDADLDPD